MLRAIALLLTLALPLGQVKAEVTISVAYAFPGLTKQLHESLANTFRALHPDIRVTFQTPAESYDALAQQVLRQAMVDDPPDVAFLGLNSLVLLAERGLLQPLESFVPEGDPGWQKLGFAPPVQSLGSVDGRLYAVPFALSVPAVFFNMDLVRSSGWEGPLPETWDGLVALARQVRRPNQGIAGLFYQWDGGGGFWWQALVASFGGRLLSLGGKVAFDGPEGLAALQTLERLVKEAGMPYLTTNQANQIFTAGKVGAMVVSSGWMGSYAKEVGSRFVIETRPFPIAASAGTVPVGGNGVAMFTRDRQRQAAAWQYISFVTGPAAQLEMVRRLGYVSPNQLTREAGGEFSSLYVASPALVAGAQTLARAEAWTTFPGENGVAIADAIKNQMERVVSGRAAATAALTQMATDVSRLLP